MPPDWEHLRHETAAAQLTFLEAEADTGITLASIALKAKEGDKAERNLKNARKAYETLNAHVEELPARTPGLASVRKKMATLRQLLDALEEKR